MPGAADDSVLARALTEGRLLLTFDKDFGALVFKRGSAASTGIMLFRISQPSAVAVATTDAVSLPRAQTGAGVQRGGRSHRADAGAALILRPISL